MKSWNRMNVFRLSRHLTISTRLMPLVCRTYITGIKKTGHGFLLVVVPCLWQNEYRLLSTWPRLKFTIFLFIKKTCFYLPLSFVFWLLLFSVSGVIYSISHRTHLPGYASLHTRKHELWTNREYSLPDDPASQVIYTTETASVCI